MEFETLIKARKSIRGYLKKPVPRDVIEEIIEVAKWAPSSMNTQPWYIHAVTGEPLDRIRQGNTHNMVTGVPPRRDFPMKEAYEGDHRKRQVEVAVQLFEAMGIARDDKEKRTDWVMRGFRQFDAPVSIVLTYDRNLDPGAVVHFDLGALSYGICLAAWNRGLPDLFYQPQFYVILAIGGVAAALILTNAAGSLSATFVLRAMVAVPPLPGATNTCETRGDCDSFQARACSRPPEPMTNSFIELALFVH